MKVLMAMVCLLLSASAWAGEAMAPLQRADFAYGMELAVHGEGALYGLAVPAPVYQAVTRADLGDLRVFNGRGVVPHLLRDQAVEKKSPVPVSLPFFPLVGDGRASGVGKGVDSSGQPHIVTDLAIVTDSSGTRIDVHQQPGATAGAVVAAYVIDATGLDRPADWLEIAWTGQPDHFSTTVSVITSDDLNSWRPLVRSASLAELRFAGHDLRRNRLELPAGSRTYLRLSWPAGPQGVVVSGITAGYHQQDISRRRSLLTLAGRQAAAGPGKVAYHYTSDGFFPVDRLHVRLPQQNALAQVVLLSRPTEEDPWQRRAELLAYELTVDEVGLASQPQPLAATTHRFWRLEMDGDALAAAPLLELGWLPQQLVFVAQGDGPYTLAYGRAGLGPVTSPVDRLLAALDPGRQKDLVKPAWAGGQVILGGLDRLLPASAIAWRRWLLWASLVAGVLLIGAMALRLFKEMKAGA